MEELLYENLIEEGDTLGVESEEVVNDVIEQLLNVSKNEVISDEQQDSESNISIYGGDDIVNNYNTFISLSGNEVVSENTVSESIITKPLNDYTVNDQLNVFCIVIGLGIGFYIIIRKAVFKWR